MRGRIAIVAGVGLALGAAAPAPAAASEVQVVDPQGKQPAFLEFSGSAGERNGLVATGKGIDTVIVEDRRSALQAGFGCESLNAHRASCDMTPPPRARLLIVVNVVAELGGKSDSARAGTGIRWASLDGGGGRDRLVGGLFTDFMDGGKGPDKIAGRGGTDTVGYADRADDLRVTLGDGKRNDGGRRDGRKRDLLRTVEGISGGDGDDLLIGTAGVDTFSGREGKDKLRGRGGDDHLFGFERRDILRGGAGDDNMQGMKGNDRTFGQAGDDSFTSSPDDGADLIVGGGQAGDSIMYTSLSRIEMDGRANDGKCADPACASSSERDNLKGLRTLSTYLFADLIIGSDAPETIHPSQGADTVRARGGNDTIHLTMGDGADNVDCGSGIDTVDNAQVEDTLVNCE